MKNTYLQLRNLIGQTVTAMVQIAFNTKPEMTVTLLSLEELNELPHCNIFLSECRDTVPALAVVRKVQVY